MQLNFSLVDSLVRSRLNLCVNSSRSSVRIFYPDFITSLDADRLTGKVIDSTVMLDRETGRSKGFGFVSFEDTDVSPFLGFGKLEIDGKLVSNLLFGVASSSQLHC